MRSTDWIMFLLYVVPTLVCDELLEQNGEAAKDTCEALSALVTGCAIGLSWYIDKDDINRMERYSSASSEFSQL